MRPHDEELAALSADVQLAVGEHERRLLHGSEDLPPELAAGLEVERQQLRPVFDLVDAIAVDHRRGEAELIAVDRPLGRLDVAGLGTVDRGDQAQLARVQVLIAVGDDHRVAADRHARVDRALRGDEAPDLLAGLRFDRVKPPVAEPRDE